MCLILSCICRRPVFLSKPFARFLPSAAAHVSQAPPRATTPPSGDYDYDYNYDDDYKYATRSRTSIDRDALLHGGGLASGPGFGSAGPPGLDLRGIGANVLDPQVAGGISGAGGGLDGRNGGGVGVGRSETPGVIMPADAPPQGSLSGSQLFRSPKAVGVESSPGVRVFGC